MRNKPTLNLNPVAILWIWVGVAGMAIATLYGVANYNLLEDVKVDPQNVLTLGGDTFKLKSIIIKSGPNFNSGHYTCALATNGKWLMCDDSRKYETSTPYGGYLFFYETIRYKYDR